MTNTEGQKVANPTRSVRRRCVLYVYGFDPAPADRYWRLIKRAGGPGAYFSDIDIGEGGIESWTVNAGEVETRFEILGYKDIVHSFQSRSAATRLTSGFYWWGKFVLSGAFSRVFQLSRGPARLFLYPLIVFAALYLVCFGGLALLNLGVIYAGGPNTHMLARVAAALPLMVALSGYVERIFYPNMMLALFEFLFRLAGGARPSHQINQRIANFADRIRTVQREKYDEVLVVGHSLGGYLALRALAQTIGDRAERSVNFMTIGSIAGFIAFQGGPGSVAYSNELAKVASSDKVFWLDVSAPRDWFSFGLLDPLLTVDHAPQQARSPRIISAKFGAWRRDPDDWRTMFQPMGLHMKYLDAPTRSGAFDFFEVTCGAQCLRARYSQRRNSPKAKMKQL